MKTKLVMEALLYKDPNLHKVLNVLNVISPERPISAVERREYDNVLSSFSTGNLKFITTIGLVETIFVINTTEKLPRKRFPVMIIRGDIVEITKLSPGSLVKEITKSINQKDFLPLPVVNKIIYIEKYNGDKPIGVVFSECFINYWTLDDPFVLKMDHKGERKATALQMITLLVDSLRD